MEKLPKLPYDFDALEPYIDEQTMRIHHGKHHQGYTNKYNNAVKGTDLEDTPAEEALADLDSVPTDIRTAVRNNGGGFVNHKLFWTILCPEDESGLPEGEFLEAIKDSFGSLDDFKEEFEKAATGRFGSGWAWLVLDDGDLKVVSTPNQDNPLSKGMTPILGIDVWEHAYYLNYQNKRGEYVSNFWNIVNWKQVAENYDNSK